jgi:hypothetical protein
VGSEALSSMVVELTALRSQAEGWCPLS